MGWTTLSRGLAAGALTVPAALAIGVSPAAADNRGVVGDHHNSGDSHITGQGIQQTVDCRNATVHVFGSSNQITALGTCWAVTVQGSSNTIVADTVVHDVTVYGWDQTVLFKHGDPALVDRGRELGMTNRLSRVPA